MCRHVISYSWYQTSDTQHLPLGGGKEDEEDILNRTSDTQHPPSLGGAKEDEEDILNRAHKPFV